MINSVATVIAICALAGASTRAVAAEFRADKVRYIGGEVLTQVSMDSWANSLIVHPERVVLRLEDRTSVDISSTSITAVAYSRALAPDNGVVGLPAFPAPIPIFYLGWIHKTGLHYIAIDYDVPGGAQARLIVQADKKDYIALLRALTAATGKPIAMSAADRPRLPRDLATTNLTRPLLAMPGVPLWSIERLVAHASEVTAVDFSPDGTLLASASKDGTILVWDLHTRQVAWQASKRGRGGNRIAFGPNGLLASWRQGSDRITIWNAATREFVGEVGAGKLPGARRVVFREDGRMIAVDLDGLGSTQSFPLELWRVPEMESAGRFEIPGFRGLINFDPGGATLTSWVGSGHIAVWDVITLRPIPSHYTDGPTRALAFNKLTGLLASVERNKTVTLWDAEHGIQHGAPLPAYFDFIRDGDFSANGARLSMAAGGTLLLYDVASQSALGQCIAGPLDVGYAMATAMSADGTQLAAAIAGDHAISLCVPPGAAR